jgi:hypothetical protein
MIGGVYTGLVSISLSDITLGLVGVIEFIFL